MSLGSAVKTPGKTQAKYDATAARCVSVYMYMGGFAVLVYVCMYGLVCMCEASLQVVSLSMTTEDYDIYTITKCLLYVLYVYVCMY